MRATKLLKNLILAVNNRMIGRSILDHVQCPHCRESLDLGVSEIKCRFCHRGYSRLSGIPVLLRDTEGFLASCRQQIAYLEAQSERAVAEIQQDLQSGFLLPSTRKRCNALIEAIRAQTADILTVLAPLGTSGPPIVFLPKTHGPAPVMYVHYLYRDWGWKAEPEGENERIFKAIQDVLTEGNLGRLLVLGAGACRLAYNLQRSSPQAETMVVDVDPFLFLAAQTVIRGGSLRMREANAEVQDVDAASKEWILEAPDGPLDENKFHFLLADGLECPLANASFDTILTPWFIDIVPADLRNLIAEIHRLLQAGGQWLSVGPLHYRSEIPTSNRFTRQEIFDLLALAGFSLKSWRSESMPYLVSKLNGRGKQEWVLTFSATKLAELPEVQQSHPPAWLLLPHLPIPDFPGLSEFCSDDPAEQMVRSAIDGSNSINDIALQIADRAGETGLTGDQFREIVRRCLVTFHPAAKAGRRDS